MLFIDFVQYLNIKKTIAKKHPILQPKLHPQPGSVEPPPTAPARSLPPLRPRDRPRPRLCRRVSKRRRHRWRLAGRAPGGTEFCDPKKTTGKGGFWFMAFEPSKKQVLDVLVIHPICGCSMIHSMIRRSMQQKQLRVLLSVSWLSASKFAS